MDTLTKKTAKNSVYNGAAFTWPVILSFFVTPFIVHTLGPEKYGIYALVIAFIGFFGFLDFGVSPSLVKYTAEYHARKNFDFIGRLFNTAVFFYFLAGSVAALAIIIFGRYFAPNLFKVSPSNVELLQIVLYMAALGFLLNMVLSAFSALPGALQRFDITGKLNLIVSTFSVLLTVILLKLGGGLISIVVLGLSISFFAIFVYAAINRHLIPSLRFRPRIDRRALKLMLIFGGYATVSSVASTVLFQLDKFILASTLSAAAVAYYVIPGTLTIKIHGSIVALTTVIFPLSSSLLAEGNVERLQKLYIRATRIVFTLLALGITPMYVLAYSFLLQWLGQDFADKSTVVLQLLLATYSLLALTAIPFFVLFGAGKPKVAALFSVISGVLNIALLFLLIPSMGINGAALAYLLSVLPCIWFVRYVEKSILQFSSRQFYIRLLSRLSVLVAVSLGLSFLLQQYITSLLSFVVAYGVVVLVSGAAFLVLGLADKEETNLLRSLWRKLKR